MFAPIVSAISFKNNIFIYLSNPEEQPSLYIPEQKKKPVNSTFYFAFLKIVEMADNPYAYVSGGALKLKIDGSGKISKVIQYDDLNHFYCPISAKRRKVRRKRRSVIEAPRRSRGRGSINSQAHPTTDSPSQLTTESRGIQAMFLAQQEQRCQ